VHGLGHLSQTLVRVADLPFTCPVTVDALWQCPALVRVVECNCSVAANVSSKEAACSLAP
jgi:hypothetical protein